MKNPTKGVITALITPFSERQSEKVLGIDFPMLNEGGLEKLIRFQIRQGAGVLVAGTTGESPTLSHEEHSRVIEIAGKKTPRNSICVAGTGSNSLREAVERTAHAREVGIKIILLVDPYYNGPSSLEIRREYYTVLARLFPNLVFIPYVIPGRTGCQLLPYDLALLSERHRNIIGVKEATGDVENARSIRNLCGSNFAIWSGDDDKALEMILDQKIQAKGVISVISNIAPAAVLEMVIEAQTGNARAAKKMYKALQPLFKIVTITTEEETSFGKISCRARNPLPVKTAMNILGMPSGPCRAPLGKMTEKGFEVVLESLKTVWKKNPEILQPAAEFFRLDIERRLQLPMSEWKRRGLFYNKPYDV